MHTLCSQRILKKPLKCENHGLFPNILVIYTFNMYLSTLWPSTHEYMYTSKPGFESMFFQRQVSASASDGGKSFH